MDIKRNTMRDFIHAVLWAGFAILVAGCGEEESQVVENSAPLLEISSGEGEKQDESTQSKGILQEILKDSVTPSEKEPRAYAVTVLRSLYRDGELRGVLDAFAWRRSGCRVGTYACNAIETLPRRVGALVAMVPSENLRPSGMDAQRFEAEIEATLRVLEPAPDKALPYIPAEGEVLLTYRDHHGLNRYLLLIRAGSTWRIGALAGGSDLKG